MPYETFIEWEPGTRHTQALLADAQQVIEEFSAEGYTITLRQLFYQLVAGDMIPNEHRWYKRLGFVVTQGRLAGMIDRSAIDDRGRVPVKPPDWSSPSSIMEAAEQSYRPYSCSIVSPQRNTLPLTVTVPDLWASKKGFIIPSIYIA